MKKNPKEEPVVIADYRHFVPPPTKSERIDDSHRAIKDIAMVAGSHLYKDSFRLFLTVDIQVAPDGNPILAITHIGYVMPEDEKTVTSLDVWADEIYESLRDSITASIVKWKNENLSQQKHEENQ